ncbi:hypothetical protein AJ79_07183 [Helicocarpus griseus UAMH5409]|uniref:CCZ1/INTU/HSP4 first Longin domain-containing protein n=1 Tax=Helicocarpus griseus UAMH5409 TaxID=1447875 RepID=A0A2B7X5L8_9EURO|nr:hypothetical protein AJ79_07183 [Helicocarpus griseus UAMH5409]
MPAKEPSSVVPAQLSFLTIYNPSLGPTDETLGDQIVFYHSAEDHTRKSRGKQDGGASDDERAHNNKKLRQIGLAQGMVSFAKNFSNGEAVDSVETEKSRIVLHELEKGWWMLASIDYTRVCFESSASPAPRSGDVPGGRVEYSSREVAPPHLILQQLLKAHSIFLLHHAPSLAVLYNRLSRTAFCNTLDHFWTRFIWNWDTLLNGNPAVDIFNGTKLAATGELGVGVGEEEWGSGEREVLEDFVSRTDGMVDLVVSRFGDPSSKNGGANSPSPQPSNTGDTAENDPWIGSNTPPRSFDGVIFSGVGAISKKTLTRVSQWMEWIYRYGEDAFGVKRDPKSTRRRKRQKLPRGRASKSDNHMSTSRTPSRNLSPGIPPPLVIGPSASPKPAPEISTTSRESSRSTREPSKSSAEKPTDTSVFGTDTFMKLLTLGYGSSWADSSNFSLSHPRVSFLKLGGRLQPPAREMDSMSEASSTEKESAVLSQPNNHGRFIIGLRDDLEIEESDDEEDSESKEVADTPARKTQKEKTVLRTLTLMMREPTSDGDSEDATSSDKYKDLQVVVYLNRPFMFTFLFELQTPSLSSPSFYRSIHHQLGPLQKPLLLSTSLDKIPQRAPLWDQYQNSKDKGSSQQSPLYDLIYDPATRFIHTSLPNIPEPGTPVQAIELSSHGSAESSWTRLDTLNVHMQIVNTYIETRSRSSEIERTCKTNRGWWVLWMRLKDSSSSSSSHGSKQGKGEEEENGRQPPSTQSPSASPSRSLSLPPPKPTIQQPPKEAFLVRKASDYTPPGHARHQSSGARFFRDISGVAGALQPGTGSDGRGGWSGPGKLAEGVGLDARRYIEALLNLNR